MLLITVFTCFTAEYSFKFCIRICRIIGTATMTAVFFTVFRWSYVNNRLMLHNYIAER